MNDDDVDSRLRNHGIAWREANDDRPGIDWEAVSVPSRIRTWLVVGLAAVAAAAVMIPIVIAARGSDSAHRQQPLSPKVAREGAPPGFFALTPPEAYSIRGGASAFVQGGTTTDSIHPPHLHGVAMGISADGLSSYTAFPKTNCTTDVERLAYRPHYHHAGLVSDSDVGTVDGTVARVPMAVSPDGTELAFVVNHRTESAVCNRVERLEVMNLRTHQTRWWFASPKESVTDLAWSPDGSQLAYQLGPSCPSGCPAVEDEGSASTDAGTHLLDLLGGSRNLDTPPVVLRPTTDPNGDDTLAPVFWWHGKLAAISAGSLRLLDGGKLGAVQRSGFPPGTVAVSSDPTGDHLLLTAAPLEGFALSSSKNSRGVFVEYGDNEQMIVTGHLYRWDRGLLSPIAATWVQAGW